MLLKLLTGCNGALGASLGPSGEPSEDTAPRPVGSAPLQAVSFRPAAMALRKLSVPQYQNSVADLVGFHVALPELESDTAINGFVSIGAAKTTISPSGVEKFESAAFAVAEAALDAQHRQAFVGCSSEDAACVQGFLTRFGQRAFRRPLSSDELARYAALASQAQAALGDFYQGLAFAVAGILQSPSFLFRVELGQDIGNGKVEGWLAAPIGISTGSPVALTLGPELDLLADSDGGAHHAALVNLVNDSGPVADGVTLYGELWTMTNFDPAKTVTLASADAAIAYLVSPRFQLDLGANLGLTKHTPDMELYFGLSLRF